MGHFYLCYCKFDHYISYCCRSAIRVYRIALWNFFVRTTLVSISRSATGRENGEGEAEADASQCAGWGGLRPIGFQHPETPAPWGTVGQQWVAQLHGLSLVPSLWNILVLLVLQFLHVQHPNIHFSLGIESLGYVSEASFGEICGYIWWWAWHWYWEAVERCWALW